jgi:hypothetical protein
MAGAWDDAPASAFNKFISKMSENEELKHRSAFLHFLQTITGMDVEVELVDGKSYKGM